MNNKWKIGLSIILVITMLAGCSLAMNPTKLIKPPKMEIGQTEVKQAVEAFLPEGAKLTIPRQPTQATAFKRVDLDGDGSDEVVSFYKKEETNFELGILVLEKTGSKWKVREDIREFGRDIDYADFLDLTGDKLPELLIGWSGGEWKKNELAVYSLKNKKFYQLGKIFYADMSIGDIDGDAKADIIVLNRLEKEFLPTSEVQLYQFVAGELKLTNKIKYEGYPDRVTIGNATQDQKGVFVDIVVGAHSAYTQLAVLENGRFKNVFKQEKDDFPFTFKAYPLPCKDENNDGVIEIGIQTEPPGSEDLAMVEIPWIQSWYRWDGKEGLAWVMENYADYREGYQFNIPRNWRDKFTIKRTMDKDYRVQSVEFYYLRQNNKVLAPLLTINHVSKDSWIEKEKAYNEGKIKYTVLGENDENIFVGILPSGRSELTNNSLKEYKQMLLDQVKIKQAFTMIDLEY